MKPNLLAAACCIALPFAAFAQDAAAPAIDPLTLATDTDWRELDPENTLVLKIARAGAPDVAAGTVVIEMAPEFAPNHVARVKELARQGFYEDRTFHRVIDDFMAQAGGLPGNEEGGPAPLPDLEAEFTARLGPDRMPVPAEPARDGAKGVTEAGFLDGFPVAYQPAAQAMVSIDGKRDVWMLHCAGAVAAARTADPNSGNFQFYINRGHSPWLDADYTVWGRVRDGQDDVMAITAGEPVARPDTILSLDVAADLPEEERPDVQVLRTESDAFAAIIAQARTEALSSGLPLDVCEIEVPARPAP